MLAVRIHGGGQGVVTKGFGLCAVECPSGAIGMRPEEA